MMVHIDNTYIYIGATWCYHVTRFGSVRCCLWIKSPTETSSNQTQPPGAWKHFLPCDILGCQEDDGQHLRFCIRGKPSVSHATLILLQEQTCFVWYNHALELFWALCWLGFFNIWTANQIRWACTNRHDFFFARMDNRTLNMNEHDTVESTFCWWTCSLTVHSSTFECLLHLQRHWGQCWLHFIVRGFLVCFYAKVWSPWLSLDCGVLECSGFQGKGGRSI